MNGGGSERGTHRIWNRLQAPSCQRRARRGARTHGPWDHDLSRSRPLNWLSHPGAPPFLFFYQHQFPFFFGVILEFSLENHSSPFPSPCDSSWVDPISGSRCSQLAYPITQVLVFGSGVGMGHNLTRYKSCPPRVFSRRLQKGRLHGWEGY